MSKYIRKCIHCEREYNVRDKRFGYINECNKCGEEGSDRDTPRLGGVMEYECKTNGVLKIMSLADAQSIRKKTDRVGGQGIIKGLAERR